ncbi:MAG TPA: SCO family protein [Acidimicrobiales bacterium]|nr:SCO family protein [Acidimicrobiales bacterium]
MVSLQTARAGGAGDVPGLVPTRTRRTVAAVVAAAVVLAGGVFGLAVSFGATTRPGPPSPSVGIAEDVVVPASVLNLPLVDEHGRTTSLSAFRDKIVVLTPFLTSCQETCPITTGALLQMQQAVRAAGLAGTVVFAEVSVDPGRDTPTRLAAYAHVTGADWPLLTGTAGTLGSLWHHFGVYSQKVPEDSPPGLDWQTGAPYTYDVDHSDGFIVLDAHQHERFVTAAAPNLRGRALERRLRSMLSTQGVHDLGAPAANAWTVADGLQAVGWVAGRAVPAIG